jgi:DNA polymerase-3 subunit delta'
MVMTATDRPAWGVYGNTAAVERMRRAVVQGPRHAYLLSGPDFIGKSRLARAFAAALLCQNPPEPGESCGACSTCRRIAKGVHPDVSHFDLAYQAARDDSKSKNLTLNISTVRDIGRLVSLRPVEARWRVVIVDDVETMQEPAQEAFLKTLEEPPSYVVILMLCTDAELLLPTLLSRCAVVSMVPPVDTTVRQALRDAGADPGAADRIAVASRGRVGLALRALADDALTETLTEHVSAARNWVAGDEYGRMVEAFRLADRFSADREAVFDRLAATQAAWRAMLLDATGATEGTGDAARLGSAPDGVRALLAIDRCIRDLEGNVRPRAALATMVQAWPSVRAS